MALTVTPTDEMKTLKVGEKIYEIVDDEARTDLNTVKADLSNVNERIGDVKSALTYTEDDRLKAFGRNIYINKPQALNVQDTICEFNAVGGFTYTVNCSVKEEIIGAIYVYVYKGDSDSAWKTYLLNTSTPTKTDSYTLPEDTKITIKYLEQNTANTLLTGVVTIESDKTKTGEEIKDLQHSVESVDYRQITKTPNFLVKKDGSHDSALGFYYKRYNVTNLTSVKITPNFTNANYGYSTYDSKSNPVDGDNYASLDEITVNVTGCAYIDVTSKDGGESIVSANFTQNLRDTLGIDAHIAEASYLLNSPLTVGNPVNVRPNYFLQDNGDNTGQIASAYGFSLLQYDLLNVTGFIYVKTVLSGSSCIGFYTNGTYAPVTKIQGTMQIPTGAEYLYVSLYTGGGATVDDVMVRADFSVQVALNRSPIYGKKLGVFGDSIVAGNGYSGGWAKIIADQNHMTVDNRAVSGGTIMTFDGHSHIPEQVANVANDCDYLIFDGGVNDFSLQGFALGEITETYTDTTQFDTNTYLGSLEKLIYDIYNDTNRIHTKVGYVFNHRIFRNWDRNGNVTFAKFDSDIKVVLRKWGIPYVDISENSPSLNLLDDYRNEYTAHTATFPNGDGWHPNKAGYATYYCNKISDWLKTL